MFYPWRKHSHFLLIKFANSEFIFAIKGPKFAERDGGIQNLHKTTWKAIFTFIFGWGNKRFNPLWLGSLGQGELGPLLGHSKSF